MLRQDPNAIMVGDIRDAEVAALASQAAHSGPLVLSSMHANDCALPVTRLINLGFEPNQIAESLAISVRSGWSVGCQACARQADGAGRAADSRRRARR